MSQKHGQQTLESMSQAVWYNQWILEKIKPFLKGDILEVGCGIGNFTKDIVGFGNIWAMDVEGGYIKDLKNEVENNVKVGVGDIERGKYFFQNRKFDSIVCINVLEHIKDDQAALENMVGLLQSGGMLVLLVPSHQFLYGEIDRAIDHYRRYEKSSLEKRLMSLGFRIVKSRRINIFGAIGWFIAGRVLKNKIVEANKLKIFNLVAPLVLPIEDIIEPPVGTSVLIIGEKI